MPARPRLRLVHHRDTPEAVLIRANVRLSEGQPEHAIKLYTEVLYELSPGSICAFLNRSLAYICLGLPELAVVDAYRAGIIANKIRRDAINGSAEHEAAVRYLRAERLQYVINEKWTCSEQRFASGEWASCLLSSVVINDTFDPKRKLMRTPFNLNDRQDMCLALELRAIYRLCGALYSCGGGVRSEAFGMIDDAVKNCREMAKWERQCFKRLGDIIMTDILQPWDAGYSKAQGRPDSSETAQQRREDEQRNIKEMMRAKTTRLRLSGYYWNVCEPELDATDWQALLNSWVYRSSSNCIPRIVDSDDTLDETFVPYAELCASRDLKGGELIWSEQTKSNVTTSIPEDLSKNQNKSNFRHFYCDTCSSVLVIPWECSVQFQDRPEMLTPPTPMSYSSYSSQRSLQSLSSNGTRKVVDDEDDDGPSFFPPQEDDGTLPDTDQSDCEDAPEAPPRAESVLPKASDFMSCCSSYAVPTCSSACRKARESYDRGFCHSGAERQLRDQHLLSGFIPKPMAQRKRQCLVDLLMLRVFAKAFQTRGNPLQDNDLVFATSGPNCRGAAEQEKDWSFTANVVRPIRYLDHFFSQTETDQFTNLESCDGWVINTLMAKIDTAMRVSQTPLYAKVFDLDGNLSSVMTPFEEGWKEFLSERTVYEPADDVKDTEPWIGSIHPIFNMIRIADPDKGEMPNVVVLRREAVFVYAFSRDGGEVAIPDGEPLLRARDGDVVERGMLPEGLLERYNRDVVRKDEVEGGDEVEEGDEVKEGDETMEGGILWIDEDEDGGNDNEGRSRRGNEDAHMDVDS